MDDVEDLPPSVSSIADYLAMMARSYDNHLKWNEQAKFKADLMNARRRWHSVSPTMFAAKLRLEGLREEDISELIDWLTKAQNGRRLVPHRGYRDFMFNPPPEAAADDRPPRTSRDW